MELKKTNLGKESRERLALALASEIKLTCGGSSSSCGAMSRDDQSTVPVSLKSPECGPNKHIR